MIIFILMESIYNGNNKNTKFIEVVPNKAILIKITDQKYYEGRLTLNNLTNNFVVYRFFNTQQVIYSISPIVYYIRPLESFVVNIKRFQKAEDIEKSKLTLVAMESEYKMTDINDAKNLIKKEDLQSTNAQIINIEIELDNGSNSVNYYKSMHERKTIVKEYNEQLNINRLSDPEEVAQLIKQVKEEIQLYQNKNEELIRILNDTFNSNLVKKDDILMDRKTLEEIIRQNNILLQDSFPIFLVVFFCSVGIFFGKFLTKFIY